MTDQDATGPAPGTNLQALPMLAGTLFSGADCARFLQGYLTCDSDSLLQPPMAGRALAAALCNIKGRVIANGWAFAWPAPAGDAIVLITHRSVDERVREHLKPYMVFSKTTALPLPGQLFGAVDQPPIEHALGETIALDARRQLLIANGESPATTEPAAGAPAAGFTDSLIDDRQVLVTAQTSETCLPQMLGLSAWGAVDFTKGCYLGQEVVARAEHRGQVKRQLRALTTTSASDPNQHAPLVDGSAVTTQEGKNLGTIVASRSEPSQPGIIAALAVLNTGALPEQDTLLVAERSEAFALVATP